MVRIVLTEKNNKPAILSFEKLEITVGRVQGNDVVLPKSNVSKNHCRLVQEDDVWTVIDQNSTNGTYVNSKRINGTQAVQPGDKITIGDFTIQLQPQGEATAGSEKIPVPIPMQTQELHVSTPPHVHEQQFADDESSHVPPPVPTPIPTSISVKTPTPINAQQSKATLIKTQPARTTIHTELKFDLGRLQPLLDDPLISEILVNNHAQIFIERAGKLEKTNVVFDSDADILMLIEQIITPLGRHVDANSPMLDARLPDGSRLNVIIPPLSLRGPCLTIRKFNAEPFQIDDLVVRGVLNANMAELLEICVQERCNMVISGGTGTGKTTLLNVLSSFIEANERIITIEDAAELKLEQEHVVTLESRSNHHNDLLPFEIRDLVRNALRMRPDRIIVGECRGGEALDMLQAMNTGHDGSLTTIHANSPRDCLSRIETMVLMNTAGVGLPIRAIREQIASAIQIVIQQARFPNGQRLITHISEIVGMEGDVISMHDLFKFEHQGFDSNDKLIGKFKATGIIPKFYGYLRSIGLEPDIAIFQKT